jgi:hypothetical protein
LAFTVTFPTGGQQLIPEDLSSWLTEHGEPYDVEGAGDFTLRALPVRLVVAPTMQAQLDVSCTTRLSRLVDLLFSLSNRAGADVKLVGKGAVTRSSLWMLLADEQDRLRIGDSIERAAEHGNQDEVLNRLWRIIASLRPQCDDRWDAARKTIVRLREVGTPDGISVEDAAWHTDEPAVGDVVALPVPNEHLHTLAWRWLSETYPGLAESSHH